MKRTKEKGITLIALVITIVVLIILAGISINLVLGKNGLFTKAKNASVEMEKAKFVEDAGLAYLEAYTEKLDEPNSNQITVGDVVSKLESSYGYTEEQIKVNEKEVSQITLSGTQIFLEPGGTREILVNLETAYYVLIENLYYPITLTNSEITLGEGVKSIPEEETTNKLSAQATIGSEKVDITVADAETVITINAKEGQEGQATIVVTYGEITKEIVVTIKKIDLGEVTIAENTTLTNGWKYFYDDEKNNKVWLIYDGILEAEAHQINSDGTIQLSGNNVKSSKARQDLINYLNGTESYEDSWDHIKTGIKNALNAKKINVQESEIEVKGSPDIELFQKTYNQMYPTENFKVNKNDTGYQYRFGATGNFTSDVKVSNYLNKPLFFLSSNYWLASPSANGDSSVCSVSYRGNFSYGGYGYSNIGARPVISIPKTAFDKLVS